MNRSILALLALALWLPSVACATAQRTFVATTGSDNPACSLAAPCRTFAAAITATSAGGEVVVLDSGGYGPVTIGQPVSVVAPPGLYAAISVFSGNGITVNAAASDVVVLRGLSINGQGGTVGINVQQAGRVRIEGCVVSKMAQEGVVITSSGSEVAALDTIVRDNGADGVRVSASATVVLDHVRVEHNAGEGFYIQPALSGQQASATITDSVFASNGIRGIAVGTIANTTTLVNVDRSVISNNGDIGFLANAVSAGAAAYVVLARNTINGNAGEGIRVQTVAPGVVAAQVSDNAVLGNFYPLFAIGPNSNVWAGLNTLNGGVSPSMACDSTGGNMRTFGNNQGVGTSQTSCTITPVGGI